MKEQLFNICLDIRKRKLASGGTVKRACKEVTLAIAFEAIKAGINTYICFGIYKPSGDEHYWIRFDNTIYDATASQFGCYEEVVVCDKSENMPYEEIAYIYVSSKLVGELLSIKAP